MDEVPLKGARILVVDSDEGGRRLIERLLAVADYTNVVATADSSSVVLSCAEEEPDLVLVSLETASPDGYELMGMLSPWIEGSARLPVLALGEELAAEDRRRALSAGARDVLSRPFDPGELLQRVARLLDLRMLHHVILERNRNLEREMRGHAREREDARADILRRLLVASLYRDDGSWDHTQRIGRAAAALAAEMDESQETVALIRQAAPLHDVGKLGISDTILLKPERLSPEEYEVMKIHVTMGAEILARGRWPVLQMAEEIALTHHERWDGSGYGSGLRGEAIPLSGRIMSLADSFDALTHRRAYQDAVPLADAVAEIRMLAGEHFDPRVVGAFENLDHEALLAPIEDAEAPH